MLKHDFNLAANAFLFSSLFIDWLIIIENIRFIYDFHSVIVFFTTFKLCKVDPTLAALSDQAVEVDLLVLNLFVLSNQFILIILMNLRLFIVNDLGSIVKCLQLMLVGSEPLLSKCLLAFPIFNP